MSAAALLTLTTTQAEERPTTTQAEKPQGVKTSNPLREIIWSTHEPSGTMIALEVPVNHPPVALCRVMSPDGTAFIGYNVTTCETNFFSPVNENNQPGLQFFNQNNIGYIRATTDTGLAIIKGRTNDLQPITHQHAVERIDNCILIVSATTVNNPHYMPPVYAFVPSSRQNPKVATITEKFASA